MKNRKDKTAFDLVNQYGTYNIQPTCGEETSFPQIAQGLSAKERAMCRKHKDWKLPRDGQQDPREEPGEK